MAFRAVGHADKRGKLRTRRTAGDGDTVRIYSILCGIGTRPADSRLDVMQPRGIDGLRYKPIPLSYTHLTLPTILRV